MNFVRQKLPLPSVLELHHIALIILALKYHLGLFTLWKFMELFFYAIHFSVCMLYLNRIKTTKQTLPI